MLNTINGKALDQNERAAASKADGKARLAYKRKHGTIAADVSPAALTMREREWEAAHRDAYDAAAYRASVSAVKRMHTRHGNVDRISELGLAGRATRKPAAAVETPAAPAVLVIVPAPAEPGTPDTVPAPMPTMTRAARKASNRELAARMRAAGIPVTAVTWERAKSAGFVMDESVAGAR